MRNTEPRLTDKAAAQLEADFDNYDEAFALLDLIDAEFRSDPMSVQCFDSRIVQRVRDCVAKRKKILKENPWMDAKR